MIVQQRGPSVDVDILRACVDELIGADRLLARVAGLLYDEAVPGPSELGQAKRAVKKPAAPAPWNDEAAGVLFVIHAGAREMEADLSRLLFGRRLSRSGSDAHTRRALLNIPDLVSAAVQRFPGHWVPAGAARQVLSWPRACRLILDEARWGEEPWTRAPGGLRCPHCARRLVLAPGWERESSPPVWCRSCPAELEGDEYPRPHRSWPAAAWIATLNDGAGGA